MHKAPIDDGSDSDIEIIVPPKDKKPFVAAPIEAFSEASLAEYLEELLGGTILKSYASVLLAAGFKSEEVMKEPVESGCLGEFIKALEEQRDAEGRAKLPPLRG